ncbi:MAG: Mo-dependent nitrogenase C-terminal domain-containing protein [Cyanobacteriota bacterium]|nr:Mo-dependent nitrogenase C-terminal domain-containing protein [Cyanobacteriota bacterium]
MAGGSQGGSRTPKETKDRPSLDLLAPLRRWVDRIEIHNPRFAHLICYLIPGSCPFERDVPFFGRTIHIPALCTLNPLYEEFISLRFRALSYLADVHHEDITRYLS